MSITTCLAANETQKLWRQFMPRRREISHAVPGRYYAIEIYSGVMAFQSFTPEMVFVQWAAIEIEIKSDLPDGIEIFELPGGLYAEFIHKGTPATFIHTADYIYNKWLPASGFLIDDRPHFEIMDENYNPADPEAEEKIYIPLKTR